MATPMNSQELYLIILRELRAARELTPRQQKCFGMEEALQRIADTLATTQGTIVVSNVENLLRNMTSSRSVDELISDLEVMMTATCTFDEFTQKREEEDGFDYASNTETSQILDQLLLPEAVSPYRFRECARYHPSPIKSFRLILDSINAAGVNYRNYSFIDVGCGLGRNLLIALDYPFRKIIGIEISSYLHQMCLANIESYKALAEDKQRIEAYCVDALDFHLPEDFLLLFFWEPFGVESSKLFEKKILTHVSVSKKNVILAFLGTAFEGIRRSPRFRLIDMFETKDTTVNSNAFFFVSVYQSI